MEIKAKCSNPESIRNILKEKNAEFKGLDHQIDTYFNCKTGRLKLREGNIENYLIYYDRNEDNKGSKQSKVILIQNPDKDLKIILENANNITVVVDKKREIILLRC
jgi:adenylate cyclase class IV